MAWYIILLGFIGIAIGRVAQKICYKQVSNVVKGETFFHYAGYYYLVAALLSIITLALVGFHGFNLSTVLCALITSICLAIELFSSMKALKSSTLIVNQMFSVGSMFIPCIVGIFLFNEPMGLWQWIGLVVFAVAIFFMVSNDKKDSKAVKISLKTLLLLTIMMLAGGATMVAQKAFGKLVPNGNVAMYSFLMFALNSVIMYVSFLIINVKNKKINENANEENASSEEPKRKIKILPKLLLVCGFVLALAVFIINLLVTELGKELDSAILFSITYAISIIITILVGSYYYKEKITFKNVIGIVLCIGSILIINFL